MPRETIAEYALERLDAALNKAQELSMQRDVAREVGFDFAKQAAAALRRAKQYQRLSLVGWNAAAVGWAIVVFRDTTIPHLLKTVVAVLMGICILVGLAAFLGWTSEKCRVD